MLVKVVSVRDVVEFEGGALRTLFEGQELPSKATVESLDVKTDMVVVAVSGTPGTKPRKYGIPLSNVRHVEYRQ